MYKFAYVTGQSHDVGSALKQTIDDINKSRGQIVEIVQSQSSHPGGYTMVTITIIYTI